MLTGTKNFAFIPYPEKRFWSDERERGFIDALELNGYKCSVFNARNCGSNPIRYQQMLREFLKKLPKPCSVFAANDRTASTVLIAAASIGIKIPNEFFVIGVDNNADICEHTKPTLTSVKPDFRHGGELAALALLGQIHGDPNGKRQRRHTFGPLEVVCRASTRTLSVSDATVLQAMEIIRRDACTGLRSKDVLKIFPCSRRHAENRFRNATGRSILEEIHYVRLARAKQFLQYKDIPLKAISDFCGFRNPNSLRKLFRKTTGMTMSAWRADRTR